MPVIFLLLSWVGSQYHEFIEQVGPWRRQLTKLVRTVTAKESTTVNFSLRNDCHFTTCKFTIFSTGSFFQVYRVTDEALIAETAVWSNFFLMNIFFALKESKLFIIIQCITIKSLLACYYQSLSSVYRSFNFEQMCE